GADPCYLYAGLRIALLTRHGKERVIAPVLEPELGCRIEHVSNYDTDLLGTFTREIAREGTQLGAASRKARIGMELAGVPVGVASEGSFGPDPMTGMIPWNVEYVVLIDDRLGIEVAGFAQGMARLSNTHVKSWGEPETLPRQSGFPEHHMVVRPEGEEDLRIFKGIKDWGELEAMVEKALDLSANGRVFLEVDLRAHANPTRMDNIRQATENLLKKLQSRCPSCGTPGFSIVERVEGLPCGDCGSPTHEYRAEIHCCQKCAYRSVQERGGRHVADPQYCDYCNP
ncbi:MAG: hypothetical protein D084_Lepto4C00397G0002, partial [Leptospirillum sp. Group IV 'UBA BS']